MPDLSEFASLTREHPSNLRTCSAGRARAKLTPLEQEQLDLALSQPRDVISASAIVEWFNRRGHIVTRSSVASHRKGNCECIRNA